jgi:D-alanyl-lipoteichoic acid acyltransferase DltB (MBOAT superfamily)
MLNRLKWLVDHELLETFLVVLNVFIVTQDLVRGHWHGADWFFIWITLFFGYGISRDWRVERKKSTTEDGE